MKAITICQPYASLIAEGRKRVENRTWPTKYRGPLAIHAGKSRNWLGSWSGAMPDPMPFGAVVATCRLSDCLSFSVATDRPSLPARLEWVADHRHTKGPYCWVLEEVDRLDDPLPCSGSQGLWDVDLGRLEPNRQGRLW